MTPPPAPSTGPRPRQVTTAAWLIMGGSVLVVLTAYERMGGLHSLETRQAIQQFLTEPPADGMGVGVTSVLDALRVLYMVAAGCATAAAILGYQVLRRSRSARLALTLLALPLFLAGMAPGGFLSSVVAASALMLWLQPSRDWFDGKAPQPSRRDASPAGSTPPASPTWPPPPPAGSTPPARPGGPDPSGAPGPMGGWGQAPSSHQPRSMLPVLEVDPTVRPPAVVWACVLTWLFSGLAVAVAVASIVVLAGSPDLVFEELHRQNPDLATQGVSDDTLRTVTFVLCGVIVVWSLAAILVAVLVLRRMEWARVALVVSSAGAAVLCLLATVGQLLLFVPLVASVVTLAMLVRPDVRAWFDHR